MTNYDHFEKFKSIEKWTKPTKEDYKRLNATAADVLSCQECGPLVQAALLAGLKYVDLDCKSCHWKGTVKFNTGGGHPNATHH